MFAITRNDEGNYFCFDLWPANAIDNFIGRVSSIDEFNAKWEKAKAEGWRCVEVEIIELTKDD